MYKRIPIKNHQREILLISKRAMMGLIIISILILLLCLRLAYLQMVKHDLYTTQSTQNRLDLVPIEPTRGLIYDRNGVLLAENIPIFSLDIIPYQVPNLSHTINEIKKIIAISPNDLLQFQKQLKQHRRFDEIPLKLRLTEKEVAQFAERQYQFKGVIIKGRLIRHYPYGKRFSHVIGYVGRINNQELNQIDPINYSASQYIGKLGIEKYYENLLHGKVGYEEVENDASGQPLRTLNTIATIPGKNIYLTIDSKLQQIAERALNGHRGAIVALEPSTGQVLAMVSAPSYDPNIFVTGITQKDYLVLNQSEDKPLYNRALRGLYPPASTLKPFLALKSIETGIMIADDTIYDEGWFQLHPNSHRFHDWRQLGHGSVDMRKALITSCDVYFYHLASLLGMEHIGTILKQFGFGSYSGVDLPDELPGVAASPEWKLRTKGLPWYEGDTILSGIGQGMMQTTPLQLAKATATLANRGQPFSPYLLLGDQVSGEPFQEKPKVALEPIILENTEHWDFIINAMKDSIESSDGTAHRFGPHRYTLAGKTGTAQILRRKDPDQKDQQDHLPEKLRDHHLFIAFAPVTKPKIALAIITENSNVALNVGRVILNYYVGKHQYANRRTQVKVQKLTG